MTKRPQESDDRAGQQDGSAPLELHKETLGELDAPPASDEVKGGRLPETKGCPYLPASGATKCIY